MMCRLACEYSHFSLLLAARDVSPTSLAARCKGVAAVFAGYIHLFQLRLLPWTMFHSLQCTMVNQFCSGKLSLVHAPWNNGDHLWKGVQDSFQVKWLLKFFSMSELKNLIFKISWQKIRSGFYRLIKLRFCMGLPKMLVILIKQIHSILFFFFYSVLK